MTRRSRSIDVPCTIEIEQTPESLHAHAIPEDVEIRPGDTVIVQGVPDSIPRDGRITVAARATVIRARWPERLWAEWSGLLELTQLYEVGFDAKEQYR